MRRTRRGWLWGVLLLTGCSGGGGTNALTGNLAGYVYAAGGALVIRSSAGPAGGEVPVQSAVVTCPGGLDLTDTTGRFDLVGLQPGEQTVTISKTGYSSVVLTGTVTAGTTNLLGQPGSSTRQWTVMVYLDADNQRESAALADLLELERVGSTSAVTVDVLCDRAVGYDTSNGDWTGARRFTVQRSSDPTRVLSSRLESEGGSATAEGEPDMGDPAVLRAFIQSSQARWPANRYLLVVWGRGGGWRARAVSSDLTGTPLTVAELPSALQTSPALDVVAFDSDLAQMLETVYQIRNRCGYVVGSQELVPSGGLPYAALLTALTGDATQTPAELAAALVTGSVDFYAGSATATWAAVRTDRLDTVADRLDDLATRLRQIGDDTNQAAQQAARDAAQGYGGGDERFHGYRDLVDLATRLGSGLSDVTLSNAAAALETAVTAALVARDSTGGSVAGSHGLSIYLPDRDDYLGPGVSGETPRQDAYEALELSRDTNWDNYLDEFCSRQPRP
ncbi:MAG: hypothetical protein IT204_03915 [Fimbriimonadaceae bacterium]|nr:hypothetical protein [Fimbriimonadaceae bacterium]